MTKHKNFPSDWLKKIEAFARTSQTPVFAAFDADGTLWETDVGEIFFQWQIDHCELSALKNLKDPMGYYKNLKNQGKLREAYLFLAQINSGQPLELVQSWAKEALDAHSPIPIFEPQRELIMLLQKLKVTVYVVTASVKWAVEPAAALLNIPAHCVLGVKTRIRDQKVTDVCEGEVTFREGKAKELLSHTKGQKPFLCSGNTIGDLELLSVASEFQLAVRSAPQNSELFESEEKLFQQSWQRNWWMHEF